jgi:BTB/POZ domain
MFGMIRAFDDVETELSGVSLLSPLVHDMLRSLQNHVETGSLADVYLVGTDGRKVPANRFVLSARSPVFSTMLYGAFREASSDCVKLDYEGGLLEAIVHYCNTETLPVSATFEDCAEDIEEFQVRFLVDLVRAADYLQLLGLQRIVTRRVHYLMTRNLPLSILVFDQADASSELSNLSLHILETRPYVVFGDNNRVGIECLCESKVLSFFKSSSIAAGELFMFQLLQQWYDHNCQSELLSKEREDKLLETAHQCCRSIQLANIEPSILLDSVSSCAFCPPELVFSAIAQQALQASQRGVWLLSCRGGRKASSVERLLVEGCGLRDAQGVYYRVMGLAQGVGGLYTKREASAGQEWVYTLSCAIKGNSYDCRLFRSKLLTQGAIVNLVRMRRFLSVGAHVGAPSVVFQPVLQVVNVKPSRGRNALSRRNCDYGAPGSSPSTFEARVQDLSLAHLSDGDRFIVATLAEPVAESLAETFNPILKVLEYNIYCMDGQVRLHVNKVAILHLNLGHWFGDVKPVCASSDDPLSREVMGVSLESSGQLNQNPVQILYTCQTPVQGTRDRNAPCSRYGWSASEDLNEGDFESPPSVMWIPIPEADIIPAPPRDVPLLSAEQSPRLGTPGSNHFAAA